MTANPFQVTEVELVYHNKIKAAERAPVVTCTQAYELLYVSWDKNKIELQEQFKIVLLDRKNSCLGISTICTGGISQCVVDLKLVFATAIKACASGIILAHNHPSGNKKPSDNDTLLTSKFVKAGKILDISVLDHLIITNDGFTSLAAENPLSFVM